MRHLYGLLGFYGKRLVFEKRILLKTQMVGYFRQLETYFFLLKFTWLLLFRQQFTKLAARALKREGITRIKWRFELLGQLQFSAATFLWYLLGKLYQGHVVNRVFEYAVRVLNAACAQGKYQGYKLCFAGRFTRRQIATFRWAQKGRLAFGNRNTVVDYAFDSATTRHGAFGIKLWLSCPNFAKQRIKVTR